ncbi:hypothetical protein JOD29_000840 [Lysinibacillus composti]|uniref:Uncharacterized protein n=1 Tax=Lysinibacillus composti TaxID=720633 RepID=A0A3N9UIQ1_9BACI|nr:hypothetical protein [Lysinibacillus composti]MBM7607596.1 hypothetical protein [Lysinibacillus composti]RQW75900.1 hypothetical protein EBB45_04600 [Lysinibacillus composti]
MQKEERKVRSDKKIDVKPTVSIILKNQLFTLSQLFDEPVKDVAEHICKEAANSKFIIEDICKWFRRNYFYRNTVALGDPNRPKLKIKSRGETSKVTIRFKRNDYDVLCNLAHALDITPTSTAGVLIRMSIRNPKFMSEFVQMYFSHLGEDRKRKIDLFLKGIHEN